MFSELNSCLVGITYVLLGVIEVLILPTATEVFEAGKALVPNSVKTVDRIIGASIEGAFYKAGGSKLLIFVEEQKRNVEIQTKKLAHQLESIPKDDVIRPPLEIKAPLVEQLLNTEDESVGDILIKLLRAAASKQDSHLVHPALITVAKNLSPDEVLILNGFKEGSTAAMIDVRMVDVRPERNNISFFVAKYYSTLKNIRGLARPEKLEFYIEHLTTTLGLFDIREGCHTEQQPDGSIKPHSVYDQLKAEAKADFRVKADNMRIQHTSFYMRPSELGNMLIKVLKSSKVTTTA